jgi:ankyrin repeat protein
MDAVDGQMFTPLLLAAATASKPTLAALLEAGVFLKALAKYQKNVFHRAAYKNNDQAIDVLCQWIPDYATMINVGDKDGKSPLHVAAEKGHVDVVKALLMNGAKADVTDYERKTPLIAACDKGHIK